MNSTELSKQKDMRTFAHRLLEWYDMNAREMPWRVPPEDHAQGVRADPYHIWLSEVMLQQTQVATVKEYFLKFIKKWPTVFDLAASDQEDVLKAWAGLGYYSRARNLKKCADIVVAQHQGKFPQTFEELKKLPGIGDYTASAIASIAFDQAVAVLDGNVERVMARHERIETTFPEAKSETKVMLAEILDAKRPGEFAQATMDLGATICTPKRPACSLCPINDDCLGFIHGDAELFPYKKPKAVKPTRKGAAFVILNENEEIFLCKRPETGLLAGMTQVPTNDWNSNQDGCTDTTDAPFQADWENAGIAKHTFTHFHLKLNVWTAKISTTIPMDGWWCKIEKLEHEALPNVMKKAINVGLNR
jgi:A/G-specific adenine glycosylase